MRRPLLAFLIAALAALPACGGESTDTAGGDGQTRTVLVDYDHDEVAASFMSYFPRIVRVHPGDTVRFKQIWTGEPHSVTLGRLVDERAGPGVDYLTKLIEAGQRIPEDDADIPKDVDAAVSKLEELPFLGNPDTAEAAQNGAQPCFLDEGEPPKEPSQACPKRAQPPFNGRQSYYNSGFIPYEGEKGNEFEVPLADDIAPGRYSYYCNWHFIEMSGQIVVEPETTEIPSQAEVDKQARREVDQLAKVAVEERDKAAEFVRTGKAGKGFEVPPAFAGVKQLAGFIPEEIPYTYVFIDEFIPAERTIKVGESVSWAVVGPHTISFDVPKYFPQVTVAKDGTVEFNKRAYGPVDSPPPPDEEGGPPEDEGEAPPPEGEAPPEEAEEPEPDEPQELKVLDAGDWDGEGYKSSGVISEVLYKVRFTKAGRYEYACVVHPRMVGRVTVEA
jgi:plastocyanin